MDLLVLMILKKNYKNYLTVCFRKAMTVSLSLINTIGTSLALVFDLETV